jgi:hypothetical protein
VAQLWLEEPHDDWLLVFDNVDRNALDLLRTHLPRRNARGDILFTTRTVDVAEALVNMAGHEHSTLKLQTLDPHDTANLLFEDAGVAVMPARLDHPQELVQCVDRLPLTVVQAASFTKQTHTSLDQMLDMYRGE